MNNKQIDVVSGTKDVKDDDRTLDFKSTSSITRVAENASSENIPTTINASQAPHSSDQEDSHHNAMLNRIPDLSSWRRTLIFIGLFFGLFLALMDTSIMATAVYTISLDFDSLASTLWAILAYQLSYLGFAVVFARLSDFIGRRFAVVLAFIMFVAFSLGCGWSQNINQLIIFRTFQGIGGAGLYALALIVLIEVSTVKLFAFASAFTGAVVAIAGVLGPIIGGLFTEYASWRWIFWLNGPCGAVALLCFVLGWPGKTTAYDDVARRWREFDCPGAFLLLAASVLVVFGLQEGGTGACAWSSDVVVGTIVVGSVCWILLIGWQFYVYYRGLSDRIASMFPFELLIHRRMLAGIISTVLTGFIFFTLIISLPLRFQIVNLKSASATGVHLLPLLCACGTGSFVSGALSSKKDRTFYAFAAAGCLLMIGSGLFSTLGSGLSIETKCYGFQAVLGLGVGLTFSSISIMTSTETDFKLHAVAQGIVAQVRVLGGSIGVAASNAMFNVTCARNLRGILTPEQIAGLQTNTQILATLDAVQRQAVRVAYSDAFNKSLRICLVVAAVNLVGNLFTWKGKRASIRAGTSVEGEAFRGRNMEQKV
uniref:Putative transporter C3H1.06c n=1 Tax=Talaromyces marneffei PM1 TaxID=1077442 RepID=A0A093VDT1_TALMA